MKKIFYLTLLTSLSIFSQNPIVDITDSELGLPGGYYVKDINNQLDVFEGTYLYTKGNTSFKIILVKKVQQYNGRYYEDLIIGEYQYIENGTEVVNTLNEINTVYNNQRVHNIDGNHIVHNNFRLFRCPECAVGEKRLSGSIKDASTNRYADFCIRRIAENGQEVMKIKIGFVERTFQTADEPTPPEFSLPLGEITLVKQ